jgi:hypothetical protein
VAKKPAPPPPLTDEERQARFTAIDRLLVHGLCAAGLWPEIEARGPFEVLPTDFLVRAAATLNPIDRICDAPGCRRCAVVQLENRDYCPDHRPAAAEPAP